MDDDDAELAALSRSIAETPNNAELLRQRALQHSLFSRHELALRDYDEAMRLEPGRADDHLNRGQLCRSMGRVKRALDDLDVAISLQPEAVKFRAVRAELRAEAGDAAGALEDYNILIDGPSPNRSFRRLRAILLAGPLAQLQDALLDYTELIRDCADWTYYEDRGNVNARLGRWEDAVADYTAAVDGEPYFDELDTIYAKRGAMLEMIGDWQRVLDNCERWLKADRNSAWGVAWQGIARSHLGDHAGAQEDFAVAEARMDVPRGGLIPDFPEPDLRMRNVLAWFFATAPDEQSRDGARAVRLALEACEITGWGNAEYLDTYAAACARAGDFVEAVRQEERALASVEFAARSGAAARARLALYQAGQAFQDTA